MMEFVRRSLPRRPTMNRAITSALLAITLTLGCGGVAVAQSATGPIPNGLTSEEMSKRLKAMTPEQRVGLFRAMQQLQDSIDELSIMSDLESGKCSRAKEVFAKANKGDTQSIYVRSDMYRKGLCVTKDLVKFRSDLEAAAAAGVASASYDIGLYLHQGESGYQRDDRLSKGWFEKAIKETNEPRSKIVLSDMLTAGEGGPKDGARAVRLLEEVADLGRDNLDASSLALFKLASLYLKGDNFVVDINKSRKYALKGAAQCHAGAMILMAISYSSADPRDPIYQYAWANASTAHGNAEVAAYAIKIRSQAERRLSTQAVTEAQTITQQLPVCLQP